MKREMRDVVSDLNKIGAALSAEHHLPALLDMIVRELRSFTNSDGGSLYIKDGEKLHFMVAQNDTFLRRFGSVSFKTVTIPINTNSIAGYVASTGEILSIDDLNLVGDDIPFNLKTMREFDKKMDYHSVSMLAVPMRNHKDEIIGVVQLINSLDEDDNPAPYDKFLEELVISLSSQAAVAICNSILIQDIKNLFESIVTYSAEAIDARSPHTAGHSRRVAELVLVLAKTINELDAGPFTGVSFSAGQLDELRIAAYLHDIGKIGVRERVLDKVNKLSDERVEMIANRLKFIRRDIENTANLLKLTRPEITEDDIAALDKDTARMIDELDDDLAHIMKMNLPKYYSDEDGECLNAIAAKTYRDINGDQKHYLDPEDVENLMVRKGNLTGTERKEIESHVVHTQKILEKIPFTDELINVPRIAATHHEMLNGTGYPNGLTAEDIPLQARMIAVADIYDALSAKDRPYKPPLPLKVTLKILNEEANNGRLDRDLVDVFMEHSLYEKV